MPKKIVATLFTLCALFLTVPVFASGHVLEGAGPVLALIMLFIGIVCLTGILVIINALTNSKVLNVISWILTIVSIAIGITAQFLIPNGVILILASVFLVLMLKKLKSKPANVAYSNTYFLKLFFLYNIICLIVAYMWRLAPAEFFTNYNSIVERGKYRMGFKGLSDVLLYFLNLWFIYKILYSRIVAGRLVNVLSGILYSFALSLPVFLIFLFSSGVDIRYDSDKRILTLVVVLRLFYMIVIGCLAYYLVPKKKDMMAASIDDAVTEE